MFEYVNQTFGCAFLIIFVLSAEVTAKVMINFSLNRKSIELKFEPITYYVGYAKFWTLGANWSTTSVKKDYSSNDPVVTYSDYASLNEFCELYPNVTIYTYGYAYSNETFGDKGTGHFGEKTFKTTIFLKRNYVEHSLVFADENSFWWHTHVNIGLAFKYEENKFYLRPFIDGWIYSGGAVWRYLHFGLGVNNITFNPKPKGIATVDLLESDLLNNEVDN
ncbi:hypothetical protein Bhyg_10683 [Pseudolycoriella hygida]|uniref:Uncharacterized protein n=1 Tax=Pseudolycoriella hygida TaxID=35572 RepID=A0A9Q0RYX9_9DIPT|nr:hypothetical protein Bhyg_10683 [Pseudolycoriella hygida]